jgi:hypothetical protein
VKAAKGGLVILLMHAKCDRAPGCINTVVSFSTPSLLPFPHPCCHHRVHYFSPCSWPLLSCPSTHDPPCKQWQAAAVGVFVSPPPSHRAPHFRPMTSCLQWQLGVLSWCQLVSALRRPVVHPASRGLQQLFGHRVPSQLEQLQWGRGVLTSWFPLSSLIPPM